MWTPKKIKMLPVIHTTVKLYYTYIVEQNIIYIFLCLILTFDFDLI